MGEKPRQSWCWLDTGRSHWCIGLDGAAELPFPAKTPVVRSDLEIFPAAKWGEAGLNFWLHWETCLHKMSMMLCTLAPGKKMQRGAWTEVSSARAPQSFWASHLSGRAEDLKILHVFSTGKITLFTRINRQGGESWVPQGTWRVTRIAKFEALHFSIRFCPHLWLFDSLVSTCILCVLWEAWRSCLYFTPFQIGWFWS